MSLTDDVIVVQVRDKLPCADAGVRQPSKFAGMTRYSLRELLLVTAVVAMGAVLVVEHWPSGEIRLSPKESAVYAAAIRFGIAQCGTDGWVFVSIGNNDPPKALLGSVVLPASRAHVAAGEDLRGDHLPKERVRDKVTGEPGSIVKVQIVSWLAADRVQVKVESYTASLWGAGETIVLVFKEGEWRVDSIDPNAGWVS